MSAPLVSLRGFVWLTLAVVLLVSAGMFFLFRWSGGEGDPPAGRLYVPGSYATEGPLVRLKSTGKPGCYAPDGPLGAASREICPGHSLRIPVEDNLLEISLVASGIPHASVAGGRFGIGDWIGSGLEPDGGPPLRGYGIPSRAARVVACRAPGDGALCLETHDRLGRVAIAPGGGRTPPRHNPLRNGETYPLATGDQLWLGLVRFDVRVTTGGLELARAISGRDPEGFWTGGERRWLGRLWPVEQPDPQPNLQPDRVAPPDLFEIFPLQVKYEPHHLSRWRTNLEAEDVLQRLIDGEWLCLERGRSDRVTWRPLDRPGCGSSGTLSGGGVPRNAIRDYRLVRSGELAHEADRLVARANALLASRSYLDDPTALPLTFDWVLRHETSGAVRREPPQPVPVRLWGVRFGELRIAWTRRPEAAGLPEVVLRRSTDPHLFQILDGDRLMATLVLAEPPAAPGNAPAGGVLCLGSDRLQGGARLSRLAGDHQPLGAVAVRSATGDLVWSPDTSGGCGGCRLEVAPGPGPLRISRTGLCENLQVRGEAPPEVFPLRSGDLLSWGGTSPFEVRYVRRETPAWVAISDPRSGQREFSEEFQDRAGLAPVMGDAAGLSGVEAAVRRRARDIEGEEPVELSIDGDLQLAAASIVRAQAEDADVTAVVLDAESGEILAVVNHPAAAQGGGDGDRPTAWDLGSRQTSPALNRAFLRLRPAGSVLKIAGYYALVNNGMARGGIRWPELRREEVHPGEGWIYLSRDGDPNPRADRLHRVCSTGPHDLPVTDRAFTSELAEERFARSCNGFFILAGLRFAGSAPLAFGRAAGARVDSSGGQFVVSLPDRPRLAEALRGGLAADFAPDEPLPRSLYGILHRVGFHPGLGGRREVGVWRQACGAPDTWAFDQAGRRVEVALADDWFRGGEAPEFCPGQDFVYPTIPSPGRMGPGVAQEEYGTALPDVKRLDEDGTLPDLQYARFVIGQDDIGMSALALAALYAPAARRDGRAVRPCLFRKQCAEDRAGPRVLDISRTELMASLNRALRKVLQEGTGQIRSSLADRWGAKTGTYQIERRPPAEDDADWRALVEHACGVEGVDPQRLASLIRRTNPSDDRGRLVRQLAGAPPGAAAGAKACENESRPLNPAGIQHYTLDPSLPPALDRLLDSLPKPGGLQRPDYHAFVAVAPPRRGGWPDPANPATGIVVAVLVDDERNIAVPVAAEIARAVERWAATGGRQRRTPGENPK
ncbi:MAG TPA: hypothetical protein VN493_26025 [Thermoanaerobaculia bacterium]|nr:hypothetical protein [Thermoanaerobaculia bacterium]